MTSGFRKQEPFFRDGESIGQILKHLGAHLVCGVHQKKDGTDRRLSEASESQDGQNILSATRIVEREENREESDEGFSIEGRRCSR